jgi:hypothetical protein
MQFNCLADVLNNPLWSLQDGTSFYFRGQRIWEAVMRELLSKGLSRAKEVTFLQNRFDCWYLDCTEAGFSRFLAVLLLTGRSYCSHLRLAPPLKEKMKLIISFNILGVFSFIIIFKQWIAWHLGVFSFIIIFISLLYKFSKGYFVLFCLKFQVTLRYAFWIQ